MRRLMLLRHAKAGPPGSPDIDRPLAARGREAAPRIAAHLAEEQLLPDLVLVSPSQRTRETWGLVQPLLGDTEAKFESRIYEASADNLLKLIRSVGPETRTLMVVGHNPGIQDLARFLVGYGDRYAFARMAQKYPTAGLAVIDFDADSWEAIGARGGRLERFVTPNSLGAEEDD